MFEQLGRSYYRAIAISDLKAQTLTAVAKLSALTKQKGPLVIDPDQRGATVGQTKVRWQGKRVTLTRQGDSQPLLDNVEHFSLHRRDGVTYLTVKLETTGREVVSYRTVAPLTGGAP